MQDFLLAHEPTLRLGSFFGVFFAVALAERLAPRRALSLPRARRWSHNLALALLNTLLLRALLPGAAVGVAVWAAAAGVGLLNHWQPPPVLAVLLTLLVLDLVVWLQHVTMHALPLLWRLHRVHHADLDYDLTTGARFHPLEILLSMAIKCAAIVLLGAPPMAVLVFEVLLNATSMFNHANLRLPESFDSALRWLLVTPDMHRVHHSIAPDETNSNFGFNTPWWDRLFGTYRAAPRAGHLGMTVGVPDCRAPRDVVSLWGLLRLPFRAAADTLVSR